MMLEVILALYRYNWWAHRRLLDAAHALRSEEFIQNLGGSFPSIHATLLHVLWAEMLFVRRWQGQSTADISRPPELDTVAAITSAWEALEQERAAYLEGLTEAELTQTTSYTDSRGRSISEPLWQTLVHLANHSTFHRGQVVSQLRQLGHVPPSTDFIIFCREGN